MVASEVQHLAGHSRTGSQAGCCAAALARGDGIQNQQVVRVLHHRDQLHAPDAAFNESQLPGRDARLPCGPRLQQRIEPAQDIHPDPVVSHDGVAHP